jgi:hypothetical protein
MIMSNQRLLGQVCMFVCVATTAVVLPTAARAQAPSLTIKKPLQVGACEVFVQIASPRAGDQVGLVVELTQYREQTVMAGRRELTFVLSEPLRQGFRVRARLNGNDVPGANEVVAAGGGGGGTCEAAAEADESAFDANVFLGEVIDNFAPDRVAGYANPEAGSRQKAQFIAGFDFDYRVYGRGNSPVRVWLQGETMHGVRTADVDCRPREGDEVPPVCVRNGVNPNVSDKVRFILENATSVEAFINPRVEFFKLQRDSDSAAWLYVTGNIGFIALRDAPKVFRTMHLGLGLLADEGNFAGSFFEVGWGKNELFATTWNRLKVDGLLSFSLERLPLVRDNGRLFVEMTVDNDLHDGPDSVRTFFGVDIDLKKAVGQ